MTPKELFLDILTKPPSICRHEFVFETYQLILIGSDCGENGFWENVGSVALLLNISDGMVDALGPDD